MRLGGRQGGREVGEITIGGSLTTHRKGMEKGKRNTGLRNGSRGSVAKRRGGHTGSKVLGVLPVQRKKRETPVWSRVGGGGGGTEKKDQLHMTEGEGRGGGKKAANDKPLTAKWGVVKGN